MSKPTPPKLFRRFFEWFCDPTMHDFIEGDLMEVYYSRFRKSGKRSADFHFIIDVLLLFRPGIIRSKKSNSNFTRSVMLSNYLKTSIRSLWKSKLHSALNITGLTIGITCFLLIALYVFDELTFDNQHTNVERIYRVIEHKSVRGENTVIATSGYKLGEESPHAIPEVESVTRIQRQGRANLIDPEHPVPFQEDIVTVDERFLQVFDFPLLIGDRKTALKEPNSIVLDEDLAMRIFGKVDVVGRIVQFNFMDETLKVTGILRKSESNTSLIFNSLLSESTFYHREYFQETMKSDWASDNFQSYALLRPFSNADSVARKMTDLVLANYKPDDGTSLYYTLQAMNDVHLKSAGIVDGARNTNVIAMPQGNPLYVSIFSFAAFFVLLISAINYTNLTTARASSRVKEIGVRKAIGAMRSNLIWQFLFESILTTIISFVIAVLLVNLLLMPFNLFVGKHLSLGISTSLRFWMYAIGFVILIGFLSGSYAALLLSGLKPVSLLKGMKVQLQGDFSVRKILVVFQFSISIIMIVATIVLFLQVNFMNSTDLGFNKDLMVIVDINTRAARTNYESVKNEMSKLAAVKSVSVTSRVPGEWKTIRTIKIRPDGSNNEHMVSYMFGADKDFIKTFEVQLLQGRNFESKNDSLSVILNETAAKMLNITEASGQVVEIPSRARGNEYTPFTADNSPFKPRVIGIVKDFHFQSLHDKIEPLLLAYNDNPMHTIDYYSVRISSADIQSTLDQLKAIMVKNDVEDPFEYHFLDDQLALFYIEDGRRQTLLGWTALATIFIACLGLFGLATYSIEQRVKEIGIRKVLGATTTGVVGLVSKDFIKLVLIANIIALPIAFWATNLWLQDYAYHVSLDWWIFAVAGLLAIGIAFLTISYQAFKSAVANPVNSLRSE